MLCVTRRRGSSAISGCGEVPHPSSRCQLLTSPSNAIVQTGLEPHWVGRSIRSDTTVATLKRIVGLSIVVRTAASCCAPLDRFRAFNSMPGLTPRATTRFSCLDRIPKSSHHELYVQELRLKNVACPLPLIGLALHGVDSRGNGSGQSLQGQGAQGQRTKLTRVSGFTCVQTLREKTFGTLHTLTQ